MNYINTRLASRRLKASQQSSANSESQNTEDSASYSSTSHYSVDLLDPSSSSSSSPDAPILPSPQTFPNTPGISSYSHANSAPKTPTPVLPCQSNMQSQSSAKSSTLNKKRQSKVKATPTKLKATPKHTKTFNKPTSSKKKASSSQKKSSTVTPHASSKKVQKTMMQCTPFHSSLSPKLKPTSSPPPSPQKLKPSENTKAVIQKANSSHRATNRIFVGAFVYSHSISNEYEEKKLVLQKMHHSKLIISNLTQMI